MNGFKRIVTERVSAIPNVIAIEFESIDQAMVFVNTHKGMAEMHGMWAAPNQSPEARAQF